MGQHKRNPTAIAAAKGELPPKPIKYTASEMRQHNEMAIKRAMIRAMIRMFGIDNLYWRVTK